ncbi:MAG: ABC transporter substrate-binding protein [Actinomycetota bacterium]|nr:ABC transporter substrate-binding protein [Actinomycetota bacterium]
MTKNNGLKSFALVAAVFLVLSWLRLDPGSSNDQALTTNAGRSAETTEDDVVEEETATADDPTLGTADGSTSSNDPTKPGARTATTQAGATLVDPKGLECNRTKNGGATDTGVTATRIKLATTAVLDGPAKSLLEDSPVAMKAVIDKVNKAGGVCGRLLDLKVDNDAFNASDGLRIIRNYIAEGYFALPVVPSAEGLGSAIDSGEISKAKIPVIGTDGMRKEQYGEPYVWPVASATVTSMRVMAKYGYNNRNARRFAIVYDDKYKFGKEGKDAFVKQVEDLGGTVQSVTALNPDLPSYSSEIQKFNGTSDCGIEAGASKCDMVALLLLPDTAAKWLKGQPEKAKLYTAGAQTLFTDRFAQDCVQYYTKSCEGFAIWTGYNPPIGQLASLPDVAAYVNDVKSVKSSIDVTNQFVEGAYLGMTVFVDALKKVGPNLTRERLKQVMDSMTFNSTLASTLTWSPGKHSANVRSQSFEMTTSGGTFRGWTREPSGFILDPAHGG